MGSHRLWPGLSGSRRDDAGRLPKGVAVAAWQPPSSCHRRLAAGQRHASALADAWQRSAAPSAHAAAAQKSSTALVAASFALPLPVAMLEPAAVQEPAALLSAVGAGALPFAGCCGNACEPGRRWRWKRSGRPGAGPCPRLQTRQNTRLPATASPPGATTPPETRTVCRLPHACYFPPTHASLKSVPQLWNTVGETGPHPGRCGKTPAKIELIRAQSERHVSLCADAANPPDEVSLMKSASYHRHVRHADQFCRKIISIRLLVSPPVRSTRPCAHRPFARQCDRQKTRCGTT